MDSLEKEILLIKERNKKVEMDKDWETSLFRKVLIAILTYLVIVIFFVFAGLPNPFVGAIIPAIGFVLSTLSLSVFKKIWVRYFYKKQGNQTK